MGLRSSSTLIIRVRFGSEYYARVHIRAHNPPVHLACAPLHCAARTQRKPQLASRTSGLKDRLKLELLNAPPLRYLVFSPGPSAHHSHTFPTTSNNPNLFAGPACPT